MNARYGDLTVTQKTTYRQTDLVSLGRVVDKNVHHYLHRPIRLHCPFSASAKQRLQMIATDQ